MQSDRPEKRIARRILLSSMKAHSGRASMDGVHALKLGERELRL
jgi:hypothetical protein